MAGFDGSPAGRLADRLATVRHRNDLLVLAYHGVDDAGVFEAQMRELVRRRRPVDLEAVMGAATDGRPLGRGAVLVTFDDGDRTVRDVGAPILRDLGIPAALFVISDLIDTDTPFWWSEATALIEAGASTDRLRAPAASAVRMLKQMPDDERRAEIAALRASSPVAPPTMAQLTAAELLELEESGVAIGSHTASHPCLDRCDPETVGDELSRSRARLEELLGHPVRAFAYPNGNVTDAVALAVAHAGYEVAFGFDHRISPNPPPDRYRVSRVRVDSTTGPDRFRLLVSGAHSLIHHARGRT